MQKEYELYCKNVTNIKTIRNLSNRVPLMSIEEFERSKYNCKSENIRAAKELTKMAKDPFLMDKLDSSDEIQGDIISKLNDYVGVNGRYTPIVSCVELQVNNPAVKDLEIVDVEKGSAGSPGSLKGKLSYDTIADISLNCECGIYGVVKSNTTSQKLTEIAMKQDVKNGNAQIFCTVDGNTPKLYSCKIKLFFTLSLRLFIAPISLQVFPVSKYKLFAI